MHGWTFLELAAVNLTAALALMCVAYAISVSIKFFSLVDVAWSYGFAVLGALDLILGSLHLRSAMLAAAMIFWSLRLGTHLLLRLAAHYPEEDGRYKTLRQSWSNQLRLKFFAFFMFQGVSVVFLALPLLLATGHVATPPGALDFLGITIWLVGLSGESLADRQLKQFKADPTHAGQVCDAGLWRYSRHPNYFFEWLIWCGFAFMACSSPYGIMSWLAPATILFLLLRVTGIPTAEAQSLRSKGAAYRRYQNETSAFVPWFQKKGATDAR